MTKMLISGKINFIGLVINRVQSFIQLLVNLIQKRIKRLGIERGKVVYITLVKLVMHQ